MVFVIITYNVNTGHDEYELNIYKYTNRTEIMEDELSLPASGGLLKTLGRGAG